MRSTSATWALPADGAEGGEQATTSSPPRLGAFLGVSALMATWEFLAPRSGRASSRRARWPHNLAPLLVDVAVPRIVAPGAAIAAIGAPSIAVLVFEVLPNATSMFNHANVRIAPGIDRWPLARGHPRHAPRSPFHPL